MYIYIYVYEGRDVIVIYERVLHNIYVRTYLINFKLVSPNFGPQYCIVPSGINMNPTFGCRTLRYT